MYRITYLSLTPNTVDQIQIKIQVLKFDEIQIQIRRICICICKYRYVFDPRSHLGVLVIRSQSISAQTTL